MKEEEEDVDKNEIVLNEIIEDNNKNSENEVGSILEIIKNDFKEKNYQKVEDNYKLLFEDKNIENLDNIKEKINLIELLNNYALVLYNQMKYELSSKILFKIIVNYDNKNKEAYLLLLRILCDINEYQKANLLMEKINKIMNTTEEFGEISKEIESNLKIKANNIKREFYCNAQKNIFHLKKQLHFFYWCFYSIGALIIGHYLSELFLK